MMWFSVETPSVFREHLLPADIAKWTKKDRRLYRGLQALAERHGTPIRSSHYRRG